MLFIEPSLRTRHECGNLYTIGITACQCRDCHATLAMTREKLLVKTNLSAPLAPEQSATA